MLTTKPTQSKPAPTTTARDYKKAYIKLLTAAANVPKAIDEFFFEADSETSDEIRPWFYGSLSFMVAVALYAYVAVHTTY